MLLHRGLALVGLASLLMLVPGAFGGPESPPAGSGELGPASDTAGFFLPAVNSGQSLAGTGEGPFRTLASFLARRYRVAPDATERVIGIAYEAGARFELDPLLILAVIAIESGFNPIAQSVEGAKGLMQVIPKHHPEKFEEHGGEAAVLNPVTNVLVGAQILKEYIRRSGSLESGLQRYNGAPNDATLQFAHRVMAELARIRDVILRIDRDERQLPKA